MKTTPLLFRAEMVRAILAGRKTETRRIMKPDSKPIGRPGDRIWVKETFQICPDCHGVINRADANNNLRCIGGGICGPLGKWTPAIFMPRVASRITLELTAVNVQWLQDISDDEALAEGVGRIVRIGGATMADFGFRNYRFSETHVSAYSFQFPKNSYLTLWEKINGPDSWPSNPPVWVYKFRKL